MNRETAMLPFLILILDPDPVVLLVLGALDNYLFYLLSELLWELKRNFS